MGKKSRENQQKKKDDESNPKPGPSGQATPTAAATSAQADPVADSSSKQPEKEQGEKKAWKKKDLKKLKEQENVAKQPSPSQVQPVPQASQQGWQQGPPQQAWGQQHGAGRGSQGPQPSQQGWQQGPPQQAWGQQHGPGKSQQGPPQQQGQYGAGRGSQGPPQQQGQYGAGRGSQGPPQQQGQYGAGRGSQGPPQQQGQYGAGRGHQGPPQQQGPYGAGRGNQGPPQQQGQYAPGRRQQGAPQGYQERFQSQQSGGSGGSQYSGPPRGGRGGEVAEGAQFKVEANYVDLNIPTHLNEAFHYDVKIDPDKPKKMFRKAVQLYCEQQFDTPVAFDGKALAYSATRLPTSKLVEKVVTVAPEFGKPRDFKVTLTETKDSKIDMSVLRSYVTSPRGLGDKPMRALQCLEVILTQQCHEKGVKAGRSFFFRPDKPESLLDGYELWYGLFQAAILGERLLLNIDVSHKAFPRPASLMELYTELTGGQWGRPQNFDMFMKDTEVLYTPPKCFNHTPKQYKICEVSRTNAKTHKFTNDEKQTISVFDYYRSKGYTIKYPDYPLIHVAPRTSSVFLPIELCSVAGNQASNKQTAQRQVSEIIKYSAISSWERKRKILALFNHFHASRSPIIEKFGVTLGKEFIQIRATRLYAPALEYGGQRTVRPALGSWRGGERFFKTAPVSPSSTLKWCVINLEDRLDEGKIRQMGVMLIKMCSNSNIPIDSKPQFEVIRAQSRNLNETLGKCKSMFDFVIVVLSRRGNSYADVKQAAELEKGMLTQCIKADTVEKRINDSTLSNILLKLNSKLNGINQRIDSRNRTSIFSADKNVMLIGADVTHPSPQQRSIPSVVGTCATSDPDCVRYNMQYRLQDPKKEIIENMKEIVLDHLDVYAQDQKKYPSHIIYYRDGVADGQFQKVLEGELRKGMDLAFGEIKKRTGKDYRPKVTCVIVQKRNHTRFFPIDKQTAFGKYDNVYPGTCVTDVICHPKEQDFFLVSHESIKGTARPTKYIVIRDDAQFDIEEIKAVTYNLCHLFPRCNRTVSYPAPAYLAHLVAARGKVYIENINIDLRRLQDLYKNRQIVKTFSLGHPMFFV